MRRDASRGRALDGVRQVTIEVAGIVCGVDGVGTCVWQRHVVVEVQHFCDVVRGHVAVAKVAAVVGVGDLLNGCGVLATEDFAVEKVHRDAAQTCSVLKQKSGPVLRWVLAYISCQGPKLQCAA